MLIKDGKKMKVRVEIQTPFKTITSPREEIDLPFVQENLSHLVEIESLSLVSSNDSNYFHYLLVASTTKKLGDLKAEIESAFKKKGTFIFLRFVDIKMSEEDTNPSKRG
jgi:hypothetical protein